MRDLGRTERQRRFLAEIRDARDARAVTRIKCCGLFREADVDAVNAALPDMAGLVVEFPRSFRSVSWGQAARLARGIDPRVLVVAVVVDQDVERLASWLRATASVDAVQLHGHEDEAYLTRLRELAPGVPTIQAYRVRGRADVMAARQSLADLVLLDNGQGTGESFDWACARDVGRPFMLAGGLGAHNVAMAIAQTHPWAVDLSSGIETDRIKDPEKIAKAVAAVRAVGPSSTAGPSEQAAPSMTRS